MKIKERILQYIENQGINKNQFILKTGIANGFFKTNSGVNTDNLEKIFAAYPNLNMDWLITGRGEMIIKFKNHMAIPHIYTNEFAALNDFHYGRILEQLIETKVANDDTEDIEKISAKMGMRVEYLKSLFGKKAFKLEDYEPIKNVLNYDFKILIKNQTDGKYGSTSEMYWVNKEDLLNVIDKKIDERFRNDTKKIDNIPTPGNKPKLKK